MTTNALHVVEPEVPAPRAGHAQAAPAATGAAVIAQSALSPPGRRAGTVVRQALLDRLAAEAPAGLVLVIAPAGWGKTSLLRDWCAAGETARTAWLSVGQADNDPVHFWSGVVTALNTVSPGVGGTAWPALTAGTSHGVLPSVINDLAGLPGRVTLVLDDFHLICDEGVQECFASLVEHRPSTLSLVVASRWDPSLPLARLRARGQLAEIRANDLRFSEAETAELLNEELDLALPASDLHVLHQRTEGWAAGLYLAGLSLRGCKEPARLVRAFAGANRQIADYLAAEVLGGQPGRIRSHLLRTSILDRFCGSLCDAVTGSGGSQGLLEELEQSEGFLVPLDTTRHWYRYHQLFAEVLRQQLDRCEPGLAPLLHRRAAAWHRQHGSIAAAIGHAISAGDLADARELIAAHWNPLLHRGLAATVQSLLDRMPPELVLEDVRMCLVRGFLALWLGRMDEVEPWLAAAGTAAQQSRFTEGPGSAESAAALLRAGYCHLTGDLAGAEAASRRALDLEQAGRPWWRAVAAAERGVNLFWRGRDAEACAFFEQLVGPVHPPASYLSSYWALGCLAAIAARRGDLDLCERRLREASDLAVRHRLGRHWMSVTAELSTADLLAGRGELAEAEAVALAALDCARRGPAVLETAGALLCLARIGCRADRADEARAYVSEARDLVGTCAAPGILTALLTEAQVLAARNSPARRAQPGRRSRRPDGLTGREAEILGLLATGNTNKEIAAELVLSVHTVERHLQNAYRKVGARNRADAAAYMERTSSDDCSGILRRRDCPADRSLRRCRPRAGRVRPDPGLRDAGSRSRRLDAG